MMSSFGRVGLMLVGLSSLWGFGCTGSAPDSSPARSADTSIPTVRVIQFQPDPIVLHESVSVYAEAAGQDQRPVPLRYRWFVNNRPVPHEEKSSLPASLLKRGDRVVVEVSPTDGEHEGKPVRIEQVIGNTPPFITHIVLDPDQIVPGDRVTANVETSDPDHDPIKLTYRWKRNGKLVIESESAVFDTKEFVRGDTFAVSVIPHDGQNSGEEQFFPPLTIGNRPPRLTSSPGLSIANGRYEYAVTAVDPEGDPLTFSLQMAPPGMTIHHDSGLIEWAVPADAKGVYRVKVAVEDSHKSWGSQEFDLAPTAPALAKREGP